MQGEARVINFHKAWAIQEITGILSFYASEDTVDKIMQILEIETLSLKRFKTLKIKMICEFLSVSKNADFMYATLDTLRDIYGLKESGQSHRLSLQPA